MPRWDSEDFTARFMRSAQGPAATPGPVETDATALDRRPSRGDATAAARRHVEVLRASGSFTPTSCLHRGA